MVVLLLVLLLQLLLDQCTNLFHMLQPGLKAIELNNCPFVLPAWVSC